MKSVCNHLITWLSYIVIVINIYIVDSMLINMYYTIIMCYYYDIYYVCKCIKMLCVLLVSVQSVDSIA